jgi:hypothetical protein
VEGVAVASIASMHRLVAAALAATLASALPIEQPLAAQEVPRVTLRPADAMLDAEISSVRAMRELSDGRLLITDNGENRLIVADLRSNTVRSIGRRGAGPGEVRHFGRLYELGGDSTLLTDEPDGRRWLILHRDSIVATLPPDYPLISISSGAPRGADRRGNIVITRTHGQTKTDHKNGFRLLDSALVIVVNRATARRDTVLHVMYVDQRVRVVGSQARPGYILTPAVYSSVDAVSMAPDGWVSIATQAPYGVTWRAPDGRVVRGPEIPWPRIPVNAREKRSYFTRMERLGRSVGTIADEGWAEVVAPFGGAFMSIHPPDGRLLLRKLPWSGGEGTNYDVIDREGRLVGRLALPERQWLVGAGRRHVYSASLDDNDFVRVQRHPWP